MQRHVAAEPVRRHDLRRVDLVDVHEPEPLHDREVRGLARRVCEPLEHGPRLPHERVGLRAGRDAQERIAEAVPLAHRIALDQAVRVERREQPPGGAAVQAALRG